MQAASKAAACRAKHQCIQPLLQQHLKRQRIVRHKALGSIPCLFKNRF